MGAIAVVADVPAGTSPPRSGRLMVASVSVLSAAGFVWMRAATPLPYPQFQGLCERLLSGGLSLKPGDTFCDPAPWTSHAAIVAAMLLVAAGFVLACGILAATGRRGTALLPFLAAPAVSFPGILLSDHWWDAHVWPHGTVATGVTTLALMSAPVVAVAVSVRGPRAVRAQPSLVAGVVSGLAVAGAVVAMAYVARAMLAHHFGSLVSGFSIGSVVPGTIAMAIFGSLLGPDRRWWPWSLVPTAILLSMAPSVALLVGRERLVDWSQFGVVLPLFLIGLVSSIWRPAALRLTRVIGGDREERSIEAPVIDMAPIPQRQVRPAVVRNAIAVGLLAVSLVIFRGDPLPSQMSSSIPTYLGARTVVEDLRTKLDLRRAMRVMDAYRATHGTYRGFDVSKAAAADPSIHWIHGSPTQGGTGSSTTEVAIVAATNTEARLAAVSESTNGYCLQRSGDELSYGRASRFGGSDPAQDVIGQAIAACGSTPWSAAAVRRFPVATMCDGLELSSGYLLCRASQALMTTAMQPS
ncbi:MAG: hypothetical protein ACXVEI_04090 [Actinomycetota bacterium]